ncbi:MAG TPA: AAA family ATPase [Actinomycetes bacterium]|nr:AAA family ATPase [Actinomycetes bacterium]
MSASPVGREREQQVLADALAGARTGRGGVVLASGDAGIGKTTLLRWARGQVSGNERTAWVTGLDDIAVTPFGPWRQLLEQLGADAALLSTRESGSASRAARITQFDAVRSALDDISRVMPVVLFVDDAQWLDPSSRELLVFLAAQASASRTLLVVAIRDSTPDAAALSHELSRHGVHLPLGGLDESATAELVRQASGDGRSREFVHALQTTTDGNPLFALELLSSGAATENATREPLSVPVTVRRVLLDRAAPLPDDARRVLVASAVAGDAATPPLLSRVLSIPDADVAEALDLARECGVLLDARHPDSFMHPLMRAALVDDTPFPLRVRLHQQVADVLTQMRDEGLAVETSRIAAHQVAAASAGSARAAVSTSIAAAREAYDALAYEDAARWYTQALAVLELAPDAADRIELLIRQGEAEQASGRDELAREAFLEAAKLAGARGDAANLARAALAVGSGGGFEVELFDETQQGLLAQALDELGDDPEHEALRARVIARLTVARSLSEPAERRERAAAGALALARSSGDSAAIMDALAAWCDAIAGPADVERRVEAALEMLDLAQRSGDVPRELLARRMRVVAFFELGDFAAVEDEVAAYELAARRVRQPIYDWYVPLWRATLAWARDDSAVAMKLVDRTRELGGDGRNATMLAKVSEWFGTVSSRPTDESVEMVQLLGGWDPTVDVWVTIVMAYQAACRGELDAAREHLTNARVSLPSLPRDSEYLPALAQASVAASAVGDIETAAWLYDVLAPYRERFAVEGIGAYCHGSVERHLGLLAATLGRTDEAHGHLDNALMLHRSLGAARLVRLTEEALATLAKPTAPPVAEPQAAGRRTFRRDGDSWRVGWGAALVTVRDSKGMGDLARLIAEPGREFAALDLVQGVAASPGSSGELGLGAEGDLGDVVDAAARAAYRARLVDIEAELAEADAAGDESASRQLTLERDALVEQLSQAYGLGGRGRRAGDPAERARSTVTARIRDAIRKVKAVDPALGRHLSRSVRTGRFCSYDPEAPVEWDLTL